LNLLQKPLQTKQESSSSADTVLSNVLQDSARVVPIVERLISEIERTGLYTIGIYRKPGPAAKVKQLIKQINSTSGNLNRAGMIVAMLVSGRCLLIELLNL